jgi:hypothetical protein
VHGCKAISSSKNAGGEGKLEVREIITISRIKFNKELTNKIGKAKDTV